ncbi:MAG: hypothetical protein ACFFBH_13700 [Promethearchaeota archaeon]
MLENESQMVKKAQKLDELEEHNKNFIDKGNKVKNPIDNIVISDIFHHKVKKRILIGFQLLIIAAHIVFFIIRIFRL